MRHTFALIAVVAFMLFCGTGCATMIRGDQQTMRFNSDPQGATVTLKDGGGQQTVTTPASVKLKRKDKYDVEVSKTGYRTVVFDMTAQWDGATIGNAILPGGSIGAATDRAKGSDLAFYKLETIKLTPASAGDTAPMKMVQYRGKLLTDAEYQKAMAEEIRYRQQIQQAN